MKSGHVTALVLNRPPWSSRSRPNQRGLFDRLFASKPSGSFSSEAGSAGMMA